MVTIGIASKRCGVHIETIRYYEREGIVPRAVRGENGMRVYNDESIGRFRFIKRCRDLGFSLVDVRMLLALSEQQEPNCNSVGDLAKTQVANVRAKIKELKRLEKAVEQLSANCRAGNTSCPILNQLKEA